MNIKRNTLKIVAGVLLVASLPAGAQVLGGGLTGAAGGMLGGDIGASGIHGAGSLAGNAGLGADGSLARCATALARLQGARVKRQRAPQPEPDRRPIRFAAPPMQRRRPRNLPV